MSMHPLWKQITIALAVLFTALHSSTSIAEQSRLATYDHQGETYFALSLQSPLQDDTGVTDVVLLFDTSASQTAQYREDALNSLESMLAQFNDNQNIRLYALDLEAVPMGSEFAKANSDEMRSGMARLRSRIRLARPTWSQD